MLREVNLNCIKQTTMYLYPWYSLRRVPTSTFITHLFIDPQFHCILYSRYVVGTFVENSTPTCLFRLSSPPPPPLNTIPHHPRFLATTSLSVHSKYNTVEQYSIPTTLHPPRRRCTPGVESRKTSQHSYLPTYASSHSIGFSHRPHRRYCRQVAEHMRTPESRQILKYEIICKRSEDSTI